MFTKIKFIKMKLKLLFIFLILSSTINFAQEIIISFEGTEEATSNQLSIDQVKIDNLTTGKSVLITETATNLNLNNVLSTDNFEVFETLKGIKNIYPNPVKDKGIIEIFSEGKSKSTLIIFDIQGKEITRLSKSFTKGNHKIEFSPSKTGVYFVRFIDAGENFNSKIVVNGNQYTRASLNYVNNFNSKQKTKTNKKNEAFFTDGDILRFTATSGEFTNIIYDSPKTSKTLSFKFAESFYKFDTYLVESEYPSFVNILFSVTD